MAAWSFTMEVPRWGCPCLLPSHRAWMQGHGLRSCCWHWVLATQPTCPAPRGSEAHPHPPHTYTRTHVPLTYTHTYPHTCKHPHPHMHTHAHTQAPITRMCAHTPLICTPHTCTHPPAYPCTPHTHAPHTRRYMCTCTHPLAHRHTGNAPLPHPSHTCTLAHSCSVPLLRAHSHPGTTSPFLDPLEPSWGRQLVSWPADLDSPGPPTPDLQRTVNPQHLQG